MRASYSEDQIRALIEEYAEIAEKRDTSPAGMFSLIRLADLSRALDRLPLKLWEVVLIHGLLGIPTREAGALLQVSHTAVGKRFRRAIEELSYVMNGGE